jgi:deoxyinosine 3'endonuclease (endonuclease V)
VVVVQVVYERTKMVELTMPYISGFLAFRCVGVEACVCACTSA